MRGVIVIIGPTSCKFFFCALSIMKCKHGAVNMIGLCKTMRVGKVFTF